LLVGLHVRDDRFARQILHRLDTGNEGSAPELTLLLEPAQVLEGRVTCADTGRPAAHARLTVHGETRKPNEPTFQHGQVHARADADGRFRVLSYHGNNLGVRVYPAGGTPYLAVTKDLAWPRGAVRQRLDLALPRGVLVRGRVVEEGPGRPVAGATITFWPQRTDNPHYRDDVIAGLWGEIKSGPDGAFRIAVLPGPGCLIAQGGTPDYLQRRVHYDAGSGTVTDAPIVRKGVLFPTQSPWFVNGLAALDLKPEAEPAEVKIVLRRGVTVTGRLVGPDGKPVAEARMLCRLPVASLGLGQLDPAVVCDGRFELPGCDAGTTYPVYFLDARNRRGAVALLSAKQAGAGPVTVRLEPCGSAAVRFVDAKGKPLSNYRLNPYDLHMLVQPGSADGKGVAEEVALESVDPRHYHGELTADAEGRLTLPALIPGATYRLAAGGRPAEFTAEAGKSLSLRDVTASR
jgi:hypothetical protein